MSEEDYLKWKEDMMAALSKVYTLAEVAVILLWWDKIKAVKEAEFIGDNGVMHLQDVLHQRSNETRKTAMYRNFTARCWVYAPYILKEDEQERDRYQGYVDKHTHDD